MVAGSGETVTASEQENADLFWGMRGAGHNFGIVTSATYKIHDRTNDGMALNGDFVYPASAKESIFQLIKTLEKDQPDELSICQFFPPSFPICLHKPYVSWRSPTYVTPKLTREPYARPQSWYL